MGSTNLMLSLQLSYAFIQKFKIKITFKYQMGDRTQISPYLGVTAATAFWKKVKESTFSLDMTLKGVAHLVVKSNGHTKCALRKNTFCKKS